MSMLAADDLAEIVQGMGQASPGPLFLIDEAGRSHPLNALAERLAEERCGEQAFVSPVPLGGGARGRVIGYVPPGAGRREEGLVSALVAMVAGALGDRFAGHAAPVAPSEKFPGDPGSTLDRACSELGVVCDEQRVGDLVIDAALCVLRGRRATLHVRRRDGHGLELLASSGLDEGCAWRAELGLGLVAWAAGLDGPRLVSDAAGLGDEAPADARRELERGEPFAAPLALVPLRCGPELAAVLCVDGLPGAACDPELGERALLRLERLLDKAAANLAGLRILRQVRREERVRREIEIARQLQSGLLPAGRRSLGELELAGDCRPAAQVGGDWFGHEVDESGRLSLSLFDVAGHGIGAAVGMTMVRSALQGSRPGAAHPGEVLSAANARVAADLAGSGLYATAFLARFDADHGRLEYASAGHAPPLLWRAGERRFATLGEGGLPLGLQEEGGSPKSAAAFSPGDVLVAYTDGIVEARDPNGRAFGRARLAAALRRLRSRDAGAIHRGLRRALDRFTQGRPLQDDATLVVVKRAPAVRRGAPSNASGARRRSSTPRGRR